jgi:prepilin-type N-terminal cleavage/methylation domain-containing protein
VLHLEGGEVKNMKTKGFTLIELLIVIALLGALAIGLLATIDPFEQLKKGRDTATRNTVTEFYNANLRYYGTKGNFPWGTGVVVGPVNPNDAALNDTIDQLVSAGELKANFAAAAGLNRMARIWITSQADDDMAACFQPESKNFRLDPNTIFGTDASTLAPSACVAGDPGGATTCFWCIH